MIKNCVVCGGAFDTKTRSNNAVTCSKACGIERNSANQSRTNRALYLKKKEIIRAQNKKWASENKEKMRAYEKKWRDNNPEKVRQKCRRRDPEKERERNKRWHAAHPNRSQLRRAADPEKYREYERIWRSKNREKVRENQQKYYAKRRAALQLLKQLETHGIGALL